MKTTLQKQSKGKAKARKPRSLAESLNDKKANAKFARKLAREKGQARKAAHLDSLLNVKGPRYGEASYDTPGLHYAVTDPTPPLNDGGKVKLDLARKTDTELVNFTLAHIADMTGNDNFPDPLPPAIDFQALSDVYTASVTAKLNAKNALKDATATCDAARLALSQAFSVVRGPYVQLASNGNTQVILSAGLPVRSGPTPAPTLQPPLNLRIDLNTNPGQFIVSWDAVSGSKSFVLQRSVVTGSSPDRKWETISTSPSRKVTLNDLTIGTAYAFQVATVGGSTGQSVWSMEVIRMAA